jgi:signal peptidase II
MSGQGNGRLFWGAAIGVVMLDVITKQLAERMLFPPHVPHRILGDWVRFTLAYNPGAAFSMSLGPYSRYIFGGFAVVAIVALWQLNRKTTPVEWVKTLALGLASGGAAGNLIDRIRSPLGVVDFIDIGAGNIRFWTFNVADSAVSVGAVMLGWILLQEERREHEAQKLAALAAEAARAAEPIGAPQSTEPSD